MEKKARSSSFFIPAILALIVLVLLGYLLFADLQSSRTEHTVTPPIELEEPELEIVPPTPVEPDIDQQALQEDEAETFVDNLAPENQDKQPVTITEQQGEFVRHDGMITIPKLEHRDTTVAELQQDKTLPADTPITLEFTQTERQSTTLAQLSDATEDKNTVVEIETADGEKLTAPLVELLRRSDIAPDENVTVITQQQRIEHTTAGQLAEIDIPADQPVSATIQTGSETLSVKDIIKNGELPDNALFYLHRVTEQDTQGLWGIIQSGLIQRFRQGLRLEGIGQTQDLVKVIIPQDADEPLPTGLSSFLGHVLDKKVTSSYIYNFSSQSMGHDPNLIHPGQQLILIHFSEDELKQIYLFFAEQRNQDAQSFAIPY